jgi:hypothetical protein
MRINSYSSIYNLGHAAISELLKGPVIVEEKIDGSQFSFTKTLDGEIQCRSKGAEINILAPEGMFKAGVDMVNAISHLLRPGYIYRGEYLAKPKHNALAYDRTPHLHVIIFDVNTGLETFASPEEKATLASELGLECVPVVFSGIIEDITHFRSIIDRQSILGGQKIEGVVIKPQNYDLFGKDKKVLMGKFVSEAFREVHAESWEKEHKNKSSNDILQILQSHFGTSARWQKAVIHLRERGLIQNAPQDIAQLMKEVPDDVLKECEQDIKDALFQWAWPNLRRMVTRGLPEWYKEELAKSQFSNQ